MTIAEASEYLYYTLSRYKERCNSEWCEKDIQAFETIDKLKIMSCATCKHSRAEGRLYACYNTEINITSSQTHNFYCAKWEEK